MLECGLRHMPVVTSRGGGSSACLEDADLLAAIGTSELHAATVDRPGRHPPPSCRRSASGVTGLASELFRNGTKALATSGILSVGDRQAWCGRRWNSHWPRRKDAPSGRIRVADAGQHRSPPKRCRPPTSTAHCRGVTNYPRPVHNCERSRLETMRSWDGCGLPSDRNNARRIQPAVLAPRSRSGSPPRKGGSIIRCVIAVSDPVVSASRRTRRVG